jgi:hypothetical protein
VKQTITSKTFYIQTFYSQSEINDSTQILGPLPRSTQYFFFYHMKFLFLFWFLLCFIVIYSYNMTIIWIDVDHCVLCIWFLVSYVLWCYVIYFVNFQYFCDKIFCLIKLKIILIDIKLYVFMCIIESIWISKISTIKFRRR